MALRPALLLDAGGTLLVQLPGRVTSATVKVYDEAGTITTIDGATAMVDGRDVSIAVTAGICDTEADGYRARWTALIGGESVVIDTTFDVVRSILRAPCTAGRLLDCYPILRDRFPQGQTNHQHSLEFAWERIVGRIRAAGKLPNRLIGSESFELAHAAGAAAHCATQLGIGSEGWAVTAKEWRAEADALFEQAMACAVYDNTSDLVLDESEKATRLNDVIALR